VQLTEEESRDLCTKSYLHDPLMNVGKAFV